MIAILDYDMANLRSVQKALEKVGHEAVITSEPSVAAAADRLVLPGVGAFADAIAALRARGLDTAIVDAVDAGKPLLGICLGLQLLFEKSYEDGEHTGLSVLPGRVVRFDLPAGYKVPHMGWNQVTFPSTDRPALFDDVAEGEHFYFVHSYYVEPADAAVIATETDYGGPFCSSVARGKVFATQFHPEKSQAAGLKVLKNFAEL
ncbi:MAG: imidazole glycerol phosphate synthase subunit HisH [Planctomycetota bacterium]